MAVEKEKVEVGEVVNSSGQSASKTQVEKEKTKRIIIIVVSVVVVVFLMCSCCGIISVVSSRTSNNQIDGLEHKFDSNSSYDDAATDNYDYDW